MSKWHAIDGHPEAKTLKVLFHIPIPDEKNLAGVSYRNAIVGSEFGGKSKLTILDADEKGAIAFGAVYEVYEQVGLMPNATADQVRHIIDKRYDELATSTWAVLKTKLKWWGLRHDASTTDGIQSASSGEHGHA